jgi:regulatory protein
MKKKTSLKEDMVALLARRDHSQHEILKKMRAKQHADDAILDTIQEFSQKGLLSEQRFTETHIRKQRRKGYGPLRISLELQTHRIDQAIVAQHLDINDNAWLDDIRAVWQKRFKGIKPTHFNDKAKQMRFLQYRGFTPEQIETLFKQLD